MKIVKYLLVGMVALCAFSCSDEPVLRTEDDDEPIIIPPPKPRVAPPVVPLDSLQS